MRIEEAVENIPESYSLLLESILDPDPLSFQDKTSPYILRSVQNRFKEIEEVFREIKRLIVKKGVSPEKIAIAYGRAENYQTLIPLLAKSYGIPIKAVAWSSLSSTGFARTFLIILDGIHSGFERERILELVNNPHLPQEAGFSEQELCRLYPLKRYRVNNFSVFSWVKNFSHSNVKLILQLLEWLIPQNKEDEVAQQKIMEIANKLPENLNIPACKKIITETLSKDKTKNITNGVYVGRAEEIGFLNLDALFVVGLVSGEFPSTRKSNPIINEREIAKAGGFIPDDQQRALNSFIRLALRSTSDESNNVNFYYPQFSGSDCLNPSIFIYPFAQQTLSTHNKGIYSKRDLQIQSGREFREIVKGSVQVEKLAVSSLDFHLAASLYERHFNPKAGQYSGLIRDKTGIELIRKKLGSPLVISPTKIDQYLKCPFQFFIAHILGLHEEIITLEPDPLTMGNIMHEVLAELYSNRIQSLFGKQLDIIYLNSLSYNELSKIKIREKEIDSVMREIEEILRQKLVEKLPSEFKDYIEPLTNKLLSLFSKVLENEVSRKEFPICVEYNIDKGVEFIFYVNDEPITVRLTGKIDRIDLQETDSFLIGDYKVSGNYSFSQLDIARAQKLQLPIYALMLSKLGYPVSGIYFYQLDVQKCEVKLGPKKINGMNEIIRSTEKVIESIAIKMLRGEFNLSLNSSSGCSRCRFKDFCRRLYSPLPFYKPNKLGINPNLQEIQKNAINTRTITSPNT